MIAARRLLRRARMTVRRWSRCFWSGDRRFTLPTPLKGCAGRPSVSRRKGSTALVPPLCYIVLTVKVPRRNSSGILAKLTANSLYLVLAQQLRVRFETRRGHLGFSSGKTKGPKNGRYGSSDGRKNRSSPARPRVSKRTLSAERRPGSSSK